MHSATECLSNVFLRYAWSFKVIPLEYGFVERHVAAEHPERDAPSRVHLRVFVNLGRGI
jgi:hypothetical protein